MNMQECYYLEYFCAFFTAFTFWFWLRYLSYAKLARARREAGARLGVIRKPLPYLFPPIMFLGIVSFLAALSFYFCRFGNVSIEPMGLFILCNLFFIPIYYWRRSRVALEIHERGLISGKFRWPYVPWETIDYCRWIEKYHYLDLFIDSHKATIPYQRTDAEKAISLIGRFIEVRNDHGITIQAGLPKRAPEEIKEIAENFYQRRHSFQFSILSLLILTAVVAAASGWYGVDQEFYRLRRHALEALRDFAPSYNSHGMVELLAFQRPLTDRDLVLLRPFRGLRILSFGQCSLTDAAIPDLISMQSLRYLNIRNSKISPEGFERLEKEMPNTSIHH